MDLTIRAEIIFSVKHQKLRYGGHKSFQCCKENKKEVKHNFNNCFKLHS